MASRATLQNSAPTRVRGGRQVKWGRLRLYRLSMQVNRKLPCCDSKLLFIMLQRLWKSLGDVYLDGLAEILVACDTYVLKTLGSYAVALKLAGHGDGQDMDWMPIGQAGHYSVAEELLDWSADPLRKPSSRGTQKVCSVNWSDGVRKMVGDLTSSGLMQEAEDECPITCTLSSRKKPNSHKSLVICDCRDLISKIGVASRPFKLPAVSKLLGKHGDWAFAKLDISNAYWSCHLPGDWAKLFTCGFGDGKNCKKYHLVTLLFGWNRSPVIFQKLISDVLSGLDGDKVLLLQYLDDVLVVGPRSLVGDADLLAIKTLSWRMLVL